MASDPLPVLRIRGLTKRFPGTVALDDVDLVVERASIHGLLGENGAGKSTLLKILAGDERASAGSIELDGEPVDIDSPRAARALGIGIVYQELSLLPNLSVADNISLANEPVRRLAIDEDAVVDLARDVLTRMGVATIDPRRTVRQLSLAERQLVEIAKVLTVQQPRLLIFDEPTAALVHHDVERLFGILSTLRGEGAGIIFVSHRYREVLEICDRSTVLRNGRVVGAVRRGEATLERLVELTLGERTETVYTRSWRAAEPGEPALEAHALRVGVRVREVDLVVRRGEIVGLCGLLGAGQNEIARAICGDARDVAGTLRVLGRDHVPSSPREAIGGGAGLISESRQEEGLFPDLSVRSNISMAALRRVVLGRAVRFISRRRERRLTAEAAAQTHIAPRVLSRRVRTLSGGNQQKSLLARWLMRRCQLLVLIEPTRGVDVGAKLEIYAELEGLARSGAAILVVSTDVPEVLGLSDRVLVLYHGGIAAELDPRSATEGDLLLAMQGGARGAQAGLLQEVG